MIPPATSPAAPAVARPESASDALAASGSTREPSAPQNAVLSHPRAIPVVWPLQFVVIRARLLATAPGPIFRGSADCRSAPISSSAEGFLYGTPIAGCTTAVAHAVHVRRHSPWISPTRTGSRSQRTSLRPSVVVVARPARPPRTRSPASLGAAGTYPAPEAQNALLGAFSRERATIYWHPLSHTGVTPCRQITP